jgi:IS30 family transposase
MSDRLTAAMVHEVRALAAEGRSFREIARMVECSWHGAHDAVVARDRHRRPALWEPSGVRLSMAEREEIRAGVVRGDTYTAIAASMGRAVSTVSREVAANGGRGGYRAWRAHRRAELRARRPKAAKLAGGALRVVVTDWLEQWWSPEEISHRLRIEFPHDPMMRVSYETIYQSLFVQGRGELRRELHRCLRTGRATRRSGGRSATVGKIAGMVNISQRPAEVADRAVPGHWEGDLIIGKNGRSAVETLVERSTRYVMLLHLPATHTAVEVSDAMAEAVASLPADLARSVTWDQGTEMANHIQFSLDTGVEVYFCDPHSPWQRGSNENTNGLLRQYMPKSTDLSVHTRADLDRIAASLNNRPRKTLGYMKPSEKLAELLASTP